ncbi:MAG: hypothetical protein IT361_12680 [Gemmatimonadaceae bacterium]|nr:hypothetical protein [Gemmatimonadaceae bacterium]
MPRSKYTPITSDNPIIAGPRAVADRLYRAAAECVRQRQRYGALVEAGTAEEEQRAALKVASLCDTLLQETIEAYEKAPINGASKEEEWYRKAITLWQASRDYERRHTATDASTRRVGSASPAELKSLAMEYDLEASALLALQHALSAYRKQAGDAHIDVASRLG